MKALPKEAADDLNESKDKEGVGMIKKKKKTKIKMKLEKIILERNCQSEDALKHIYAVLISNKDIMITIDLPSTKDRICNDDSEESSDEERGISQFESVRSASVVP